VSARPGGLQECPACHRPTRPQGSDVAEYPGSTVRMARDLCARCYALDRRGVDPYAAVEERAKAEATRVSGDNQSWLKIGSPVQLVRWVRTRDGDVARLVEGEDRGRTPKEWSVKVLGEVVQYDRADWEVTTP
jgi:hypothetical protein